MKTILVPTGGGEKDQAVFDTALALARPFSSHLDFFHVRMSVGEAAIYTPHVDFAQGPGLWEALRDLQLRSEAHGVAASRHVKEFCAQHNIPMTDGPTDRDAVSASWQEENGSSAPLIMRRARHSDIVVMGRHTIPDGLPPDLIELLLIGCGRPILIAPSQSPRTVTGTVMICWKECAEAARAVSAAMPLLTHAERVIVASVSEGDDKSAGGADELARYLIWHRIHPEIRRCDAGKASTSQLLLAAAQDLNADLVVIGGYGHSRMREVVFGGCTQTFIQDAGNAAVFVLH